MADIFMLLIYLIGFALVFCAAACIKIIGCGLINIFKGGQS